MYLKEELQDKYILDIILVNDNYDSTRIARFNFKNKEGNYKGKDLTSYKILTNKLWREYPNISGISQTVLNNAIQAGKDAQKVQTIIWEYQDIARKLKSDYDYSIEKLQNLFSRAAELETYFITNNMQDYIIMM